MLFRVLKAFILQNNVGTYRNFAKAYFKAGIVSLAVKSLISQENENE